MLARSIVAFLTLLASWGVLEPRSFAADALGLALERTIPLKSVTGRIDHMAVDVQRGRLAVAELGNDSVDIIDLGEGRVVHQIAGLQAPQGIAYALAAGLLAVASAGDGSVRFFRASDFLPAGQVDLGEDADNIHMNGLTGHLLVGYGKGGLAVIDPVTRSKIADIALPAHPEGFQLAPDGGRAFVNVPDAQQVAVVDLVSGKQIAGWKTPGVQSNFPMAIDGPGNTLAIAFRDPPRLLLLATGSSSVVGNVETCGDADDVFFDSRRRRVYVSCGEGAVDVFDRSAGKLRRIAHVTTSPGARTALFVPQLDRLFVACRADAAGGAAKLLVFRPSP